MPGPSQRCLFWRRELARPYGRVDRARLKRMLLERCIAQGAPLSSVPLSMLFSSAVLTSRR